MSSSKPILAPTLRSVGGITEREPNLNVQTTRNSMAQGNLVAVEVTTTGGRKLRYGVTNLPINGGSMVNGNNIRRY